MITVRTMQSVPIAKWILFTVHLADVDDLLDGLDDAARESLIHSEAVGAYLVDGRPLPPEYKS
jgi:hypothetical protein